MGSPMVRARSNAMMINAINTHSPIGNLRYVFKIHCAEDFSYLLALFWRLWDLSLVGRHNVLCRPGL